MGLSRDSNQNIANATVSYIKTALIYEAKPYLKEEIKSAINLNVARRILFNYKKGEAIYYFDDNYLHPELKKSLELENYYHRVTEIDEEGLLTRILLREFKTFGLKLNQELSSEEHLEESRKFFDFVYNISTREKEERTELCFIGRNIFVGVILVSNLETYRKYGTSPYIQRIKMLASKGVETFYLLARGQNQISILNEIRNCNKKDANFQELNYQKYRIGSQEIVCALIEVDYNGLIVDTKKKLAELRGKDETVDAIVMNVHRGGLDVDIDGIGASIPLTELSTKDVIDARKYFQIDNELKVKVLNAENVNNVIVSCKGTDCDPILRIEKDYTADKQFNAKIKEIKKGGLLVELEDGMEGFVPRIKATFSRYQELDTTYSLEQKLKVTPIRYDLYFNNLILSIANLKDPWSSLQEKVKEGEVVDVEICSIEQRKIICELELGVKCLIWQSDLDWMHCDVNSLGLKIGDIVRVMVKKIDLQRRIIFLSRKEALLNPYEKYFAENGDVELNARVVGAIDKTAVELEFDEKLKGRIHISELDWAYIDDIKRTYPVDKIVKVKLLALDNSKDIIWATRKRLITNPVQEFEKSYSIGDIVKGNIVRVERWGAQLSLEGVESGVSCVITKRELTNLFFVNDVKSMLEERKTYSFIIKSISLEQQRVLLSRREYFSLKFKELVCDYEKSHIVKVIGRTAMGEFIVESDDNFQAILLNPTDKDKKYKKLRIGDIIEVGMVSFDKANEKIEVSL